MKILRSIAILVGAVSILTTAGVFVAPAQPVGAVDICQGAGARCTTFVDKYINPFIILLSSLIGVLAIISIIVAGIQYSSSADDPGAVTKAKQRIFNTVIGLVAYIFLFAFLSWLIPGGFIK